MPAISRRVRWVAGASVAGAVAVVAMVMVTSRATIPTKYVSTNRPPSIRPDYADCVIPPNIAPLNFVIDEPGSAYRVSIHGQTGREIVVASSDGSVTIPLQPWGELLAANRGGQVQVDVYARPAGKPWQRFSAITLTVASEDIDPYLAYRLLGPLHNVYINMATWERDITSFRQRPLLRSGGGRRCVNCHTFANNRPDQIIMHMRGTDGVAMLLGQSGQVDKIGVYQPITGTSRTMSGAASYTAWHPSGKAAAVSFNDLIQLHKTLGESREVFDFASDLGVYVIATQRLISDERIAHPDFLETYPAWSPDGQFLYFSRAPRDWAIDAKIPKVAVAPEAHWSVRYDLMRIRYDVTTGTWGDLEEVLSSTELGKSLTQPRISPDGRWLLFTAADYGHFPIFMDNADLYMMDLTTREVRRIQANSDRGDTWHGWSSNGRWIVFSSKRDNGLLARTYFSYVDQQGRTHKPFVLPQEDPTCDESLLKAYNAPELITGPVPLDEDDFLSGINVQPDEQVEAVSGATPPGEGPSATEYME